jgi:uncharacterized membrane protein
MWDDHGYDMMDGSGWMAALLLLVGLLVVVVLAVGAYVVVQLSRREAHGSPAAQAGRGLPPSSGPEDPRRVLDLRLARGEVTPGEYEAARALLDRPRPGPT